MRHLLIFEGGELVGKSYSISEVYNQLEEKYQTNNSILNGCHWLNCDIGLFGDQYGRLAIEKYLELVEQITDRHIILEKFHLSDMAYSLFYQKKKISYNDIESRLLELGARLIFCRTANNLEIFRERLADRLALYPHYQRIAKTPQRYLELQNVYQQLISESKLPTLTVDTTVLPNKQITKEILQWLNE